MANPPPAPHDMASKRTISVFLKRSIDRVQIMGNIPRTYLEAHSGSFCRFLVGWPVDNEDHRDITLPTGSPGGLKHVLEIIKTRGDKENFYINIYRTDIVRAIAIWEAADILDLEPKTAMGKLTSYICGRLAHGKTTPEIMEKIDTVFRPDFAPEDVGRRRVWDGMIHQHVWDLVHEKYVLEEQQALEAMSTRRAELRDAVAAKKIELQAMKDVHDLRPNVNSKRGNGSSRRWRKKEKGLMREAEAVKAGLRPWRAEVEPYLHLTRDMGEMKVVEA